MSAISTLSRHITKSLQTCDRKIFTLAGVGKLYQFTRLLFDITKALPVFQLIIDDLTSRSKLKGAKFYLDDLMISGSTKKEQDEFLKTFVDAAAKTKLTFNQEKCAIGLTI